MGLDIRLPIGLMFSLVGVLLLVAGSLYDNAAARTRSLGINIDLIWGLVLLAFGLWMLWMALRGRRKNGEK